MRRSVRTRADSPPGRAEAAKKEEKKKQQLDALLIYFVCQATAVLRRPRITGKDEGLAARNRKGGPEEKGGRGREMRGKNQKRTRRGGEEGTGGLKGKEGRKGKKTKTKGKGGGGGDKEGKNQKEARG